MIKQFFFLFFSSENARVPEEVITSMASKLEVPNPLKNSWEQFSFRLAFPNVQDPLDICLSMISMTMDNPVKPLEDKSEEKAKSRAICNANVIHQADKLLRKTVSAKIKDFKENSEEVSKEDLKAKAAEFNAIKDEVLEDLRTGFAPLSKEIVAGVSEKKSTADDIEKLNVVVQELFEMKIK